MLRDSARRVGLAAENRPRYFVMATQRSLGIRLGEYYLSDGRNLVLESPGRRKKIIGPLHEALGTGLFKPCDPLLEYSLKPLATGRGSTAVAERYAIPKAERKKILHQLWPYVEKPPRLSARRFDLIAEKLFTVGDFIVVRQFGSNLLCSPYGNSVINWAPASWSRS